MGKKNNKKKSIVNTSNLPNVSICTPTFNRRPFFEGLIQCIRLQDYPHDKIEWIIVDDGTDSVKDIFDDEKMIESLKGIKVKYFYHKQKMDLGKKRNYMHKKCEYTGDNDIIVYMDDDDYYPPERVSHSVKKLMSDPKVLCGGSSELYLWFNTLDKMYKFGPYGPNHATAGTFAFKRKLLKETSYEDSAVLAEEKHFLKNYTVPFIQFDPFKTILVVSHEQNTFDKKKLLIKENSACKETHVKVNQFIKNNQELRNFYKEKINNLLKDYEPGKVENKPKVLEEIDRREKERKKMIEEMKKKEDAKKSGITITNERGEVTELTIGAVRATLKNCQQQIAILKNQIQNLTRENIALKEQLNNNNNTINN